MIAEDAEHGDVLATDGTTMPIRGVLIREVRRCVMAEVGPNEVDEATLFEAVPAAARFVNRDGIDPAIALWCLKFVLGKWDALVDFKLDDLSERRACRLVMADTHPGWASSPVSYGSAF